MYGQSKSAFRLLEVLLEERGLEPLPIQRQEEDLMSSTL